MKQISRRAQIFTIIFIGWILISIAWALGISPPLVQMIESVIL